MRTGLLKSALLGAAAIGIASLAAAPAHADLYNPVWTVRVWQSNNTTSKTDAILPRPGANGNTATPTAKFIYSGQINFSTNMEIPTFGDFFGPNAKNAITSFTGLNKNGVDASSLGSFLKQKMTNTSNAVVGNGNLYSYFDFSLQDPGHISTGTVLSVTHKRGASVYVGAYDPTKKVPSSDEVIGSGSPAKYLYGTPSKTNVATLQGSDPTNFDVVYVAESGSKDQPYSVLKVAVPEPGSLALLGTGLLGLGLIGRRRRRKA